MLLHELRALAMQPFDAVDHSGSFMSPERGKSAPTPHGAPDNRCELPLTLSQIYHGYPTPLPLPAPSGLGELPFQNDIPKRKSTSSPLSLSVIRGGSPVLASAEKIAMPAVKMVSERLKHTFQKNRHFRAKPTAVDQGCQGRCPPLYSRCLDAGAAGIGGFRRREQGWLVAPVRCNMACRPSKERP